MTRWPGVEAVLRHAPSWASTKAPVVVVTLALTFVAGGCRAPAPRPVPGPVSSPTVAPVDGPVAFHIRLGAGQTLTTYPPDPAGRCPAQRARIHLGSERTIELTAQPTSCDADSGHRPGNGFHGVYRTSADIPDERRKGAVTVHTTLGDAIVFTQPYYECTNSCKDYTEPVAVISLTNPRDPSFPTLTVYSARGSIGRDRLITVLRDQILP